MGWPASTKLLMIEINGKYLAGGEHEGALDGGAGPGRNSDKQLLPKESPEAAFRVHHLHCGPGEPPQSWRGLRCGASRPRPILLPGLRLCRSAFLPSRVLPAIVSHHVSGFPLLLLVFFSRAHHFCFPHPSRYHFPPCLWVSTPPTLFKRARTTIGSCTFGVALSQLGCSSCPRNMQWLTLSHLPRHGFTFSLKRYTGLGG